MAGTLGTAHEIASDVRAGRRSAVDVLDAAAARIARHEPSLHAFQALTLDGARRDAEAVDGHPQREDLPLAGVPVVVKDDVAVAGVAVRRGSLATDPTPQAEDDLLVTRLRAAGAVVLGTTTVPELYASAATETLAFGATLNPWDRSRTPGGSSGGTGAALAAGYAPIGVGSDGLGSIRIPSACCGLVGLKPGPGVVPHPPSAATWFGMSEHGPLATTVEDVALLLDVLAGTGSYRQPQVPQRPLRIAVSLGLPAPPARLDPAVARVVRETGGLLRAAGHTVVEEDPPYPPALALEVSRRFFTSIVEDAEGLDLRLLERRIANQVRIGRFLQRVWPSHEEDTAPLRRRVEEWFSTVDVCILPTLLRPPLRVGSLLGRSVVGAAVRQSQFVQHTFLANLIGFPAASVPAGVDRDGLPVAVQLLAPRGGEGLLLSVARQIEQLRPWARTAPLP